MVLLNNTDLRLKQCAVVLSLIIAGKTYSTSTWEWIKDNGMNFLTLDLRDDLPWDLLKRVADHRSSDDENLGWLTWPTSRHMELTPEENKGNKYKIPRK